MYTYKYPHPAVTTDSVVFGFDGRRLHILLIERGIDPFKGSWGLPGGFMRMDETVEQCAARELREETGVHDIFLEQFHVFSSIERDPRERVLTVAFIALVRESDYVLMAGDDAANASWFELEELPPLAFDHKEIIQKAREQLPVILRTRPIAFKLLDEQFSMSELQRLYEAINNTTYDRRNFAKKMNSTGYMHKVELPEAADFALNGFDAEDNIVVDKSYACQPKSCTNNARPPQAKLSKSENSTFGLLRRRRKGVNLFEFDENAFNEDIKLEPPGRNPLLDI